MKTMFKTISAAALAVSLAGVASADSDSATVTLGSNTGAECDVDAVATGLNITIALDQTVADVSIECNYYGNVTIEVDSANDFVLSGSGPDLPYSIDYVLGDASPIPIFAALLEATEVDNVDEDFSITVDNTGGVFLEPVQYEVRANVDSQDVGQTFAGSRQDDITISISTD